MSSPRIRRRFQNPQPEDLISNLPDTIVTHILSLLGTKSAVSTSILSKRWKYVWTEVPTLDFTELPLVQSYRDLTSLQRSYFRSFVDKVLLHNSSSYVKRLNFDFRFENDDFYVKSWLSALTRREAREVIIRDASGRREPFVLPTQLLSGERLVVLKLTGLFAVDAPTSLHLPNLETVHLIYFCFPDDEFMKRLSLGSPFLKELVIKYCRGITSKLYVEFLTLERLEMTQMSCDLAGGIVIRTPSLRYLALYILFGVKQYDIGDLSFLEEANLHLSDCDLEDMIPLLRKVSGVKTLHLLTVDCTVLHSSEPPIFQNLSCLNIGADEITYKLLGSAPSLKSLIFLYVLNVDYDSFESKPVPKVVSCLESVEFIYSPSDVEDMMRLVAYFFKNALVLKELKIHMHHASDPECEIDDVYQKLLMLPRYSTCRVRFGRPT